MINGYKFLIPRGSRRVSINSNSVKNDHHRFYTELLDYLTLYQKGNKFIVNLGQVEEVDSSCVASLIRLLQATKKKRVKLILEDVSGNIRHNLEIAKTEGIFNFQES